MLVFGAYLRLVQAYVKISAQDFSTFKIFATMTDHELLLEICVDSLESIRNAIAGGANRLELCSALSEGGLTPSLGLAKLAKRVSPIPIFAMIRIRGGHFVYEPEELDAMLEDLRLLKSAEIDGFVFGALTPNGQLDVQSCRKIIEAAHPLPVTFHRAFDEVSEPLATLDAIRELGFARLLTSGQKESAEKGLDLIADLVKRAGNGIVVIPGAGITENNILTVRCKSGTKEFHGSAKRARTDGDRGITVTDADSVRKMVEILRGSL